MANVGGSPFPNGAVAVVDALGFKGIWKRAMHPQVVFDALSTSKERVKADEKMLTGYLKGVGSFTVRFFSDSVVIVCTGDLPPGLAINAVASSVASLMAAALLPSHPEVRLTYRGCIAYGPIIAHDEFFVGSAIDEAAEASSCAEAAVAWLLPSAVAHIRVEDVEPYLVPWGVPTKVPGNLNTYIVNPFPQFEESELTEGEAMTRCLATFGAAPSLSVAIKKQNTENALQVARHAFTSAQARRKAEQHA